MTTVLTSRLMAVALAGSAVSIASPAPAQDGSASTRSLNTAPAQSVLTPRANAQPPLAPARQAPTRQAGPTPPPLRTLEDVLGKTGEAAPASGVTLADGQTEPDPIPMTLGYYVRGEMACDQAWPGQGDLAFATPTAFALDYGGCEPGPWLQTGPNSWREEQRCITESGGDAGGYSVTYEVIGLDVVLRTARLAIDNSEEKDQWHHCRAEDLSENARFMS